MFVLGTKNLSSKLRSRVSENLTYLHSITYFNDFVQSKQSEEAVIVFDRPLLESADNSYFLLSGSIACSQRNKVDARGKIGGIEAILMSTNTLGA